MLGTIEDLVFAYPEALEARDGAGRMPLHVAVDREEPSEQVVSLLLDAYPLAAQVKRGVGRLPLHYAIFSDSPNIAVIRKLIDAYPEGCRVADVYGRLPLHYAVDKAKGSSETVVDMLLKSFPQGQSMMMKMMMKSMMKCHYDDRRDVGEHDEDIDNSNKHDDSDHGDALL